MWWKVYIFRFFWYASLVIVLCFSQIHAMFGLLSMQACLMIGAESEICTRLNISCGFSYAVSLMSISKVLGNLWQSVIGCGFHFQAQGSLNAWHLYIVPMFFFFFLVACWILIIFWNCSHMEQFFLAFLCIVQFLYLLLFFSSGN